MSPDEARALAAGLDLLGEALGDKPEKLERFDLETLRLAYSTLAGVVGQLADVAMDDEPDDDMGATIQHLGAAMRHLSGVINVTAFRQTGPSGCSSAETAAAWEEFQERAGLKGDLSIGADPGQAEKPSGKVGLRKKEAGDGE